MKNIIKISALALASSVAFIACKYEEGPRISLRSKRDRASNEWRISSLTIDGKDETSKVNDSTKSFAMVLNMFRTGAYSINLVKVLKDTATGAISYETTHTGNNSFGDPNDMWDEKYILQFWDSLPSVVKQLNGNGGGKWAFEKGHYKIVINPNLSYDPEKQITQVDPIFWTIVKLSEKEMKVKGLNELGKPWEMTLKSINKEPYFF
jgi:hypothetical protein